MVLKKSNARLAALTWVLIFGGMLSLALGLTLRRSDDAIGLAVALTSGAAIVVGLVLVWVRSRRPDGSGHDGDPDDHRGDGHSDGD